MGTKGVWTVFLFVSLVNVIKYNTTAAAAAKLLHSCLTLCDPIDGSPPGSLVPGILQARTLKRVAIPFSNAWKWKVKGKSLIRVLLLATPWTIAYQAPPSMGFSRQEYWTGCHCLLRTLPQYNLFWNSKLLEISWCHREKKRDIKDQFNVSFWFLLFLCSLLGLELHFQRICGLFPNCSYCGVGLTGMPTPMAVIRSRKLFFFSGMFHVLPKWK